MRLERLIQLLVARKRSWKWPRVRESQPDCRSACTYTLGAGKDPKHSMFSRNVVCRRQDRIINHMNPAISDERYQHGMLDAGTYLAYDLFGFDHSLLGQGRYAPSDFDVAHQIVELIRRGNRDQILISHDIGVRTRLRRYGGWGYSHILRHISSSRFLNRAAQHPKTLRRYSLRTPAEC